MPERFISAQGSSQSQSAGRQDPLGEGHGGHCVCLNRRQHLFAEAFQVPHKHLMWHGALIEVEHQRAGAQALGQLDQTIAYLLWRSPCQSFTALQVRQGGAAESLEAAQKTLPVFGPDIVVVRFLAVARLHLSLHTGDITMAKQRMEE